MTGKMIISALAAIVFCSGCAASRIVDDVSMIQAASFDKGEDYKLIGGFMMPVYKSPDSTESFILSAEGDAVREIRIKLNGRSPRPLVPGQLRVTLFGESLAEEGLIDIVDVMYRDATIGMRPFLAVVKGEALSLIEQESRVTEHSAIYIANLIEQNIEDEFLPRTNLHVFLNSYFNDGKDPFLPYIEKEKKHVKLSGIAVLNGDKMVGKLDLKDTLILKLLSKESYRDGSYILKFGDNELAIIENVVTDTKYDVKGGKQPGHFTIHVKFQGIVKEFSGKGNLENSNGKRNQIEEALEKEIEQAGTGLVEKLQSLNADTLGLGEYYRSTTRDWDPKEWKKHYPDVKVTVKVDAEILETGVTE